MVLTLKKPRTRHVEADVSNAGKVAACSGAGKSRTEHNVPPSMKPDASPSRSQAELRPQQNP